MSIFARIVLNETAEATLPAPVFSVVRSVDVAKADQGRQLVAQAWIRADEIVADAHAQAAAHVAQARIDTAAAQSAWYEGQAALFESRTAQAIDLLCRATGQIAEAVIAAIFERSPALPIQASVEIAVRLLRAEMRSHVLCHSLDFDVVDAASASLGAIQTQTDESVRRGELIFRDAQGEVRVDGTDALLQLLSDWKTALANALPPLPLNAISSPSHATFKNGLTAAPSTPESEMTP
ncbi:hypothetical protein ACSFA3_04060 [Variovorax sp. RHLX14]|uniref:hypothetical protein n=1 Tax=Variovorax sp. RHLX14 TaxID=1259731 RepID=UPI003F4678B0